MGLTPQTNQEGESCKAQTKNAGGFSASKLQRSKTPRDWELVKEINELLEKKQDRLGHVAPSDKDSPAKLN